MKQEDILRNELDIDYSTHWLVRLGVKTNLFKIIPQGIRNSAARKLKADKPLKRRFPFDDRVEQISAKQLEDAVGKDRIYAVVEPWPADFAACFTHDVDSDFEMNKGTEELLLLEEKLGVRATIFLVADSVEYKLNRAKIADWQKRGHEPAIHGLKHDGKFHLTNLNERLRRLTRARKIMQQFDSVGFRAPWLARTKDMALLLSKSGYMYDSSYPDTDPYTIGYEGAGCCTVFPFKLMNTGVVELPVTMPQDWMLIQAMKMSPRQIFTFWKKKLDYIADAGGLALFLTHAHPTTILTPKRKKVYADIIKYVKSKKVFVGTCREIADRWLSVQNVKISIEDDRIKIMNNNEKAIKNLRFNVYSDIAINSKFIIRKTHKFGKNCCLCQIPSIQAKETVIL